MVNQGFSVDGGDMLSYGQSARYNRDGNPNDDAANWSGAVLDLNQGQTVELVAQRLDTEGITVTVENVTLQGLSVNSLFADLSITNLNGLSVEGAGTTVLTQDMLNTVSTAGGVNASDIVYTITGVPDSGLGTVELSGSGTLAVSNTFTQQDIIDGNVSFVSVAGGVGNLTFTVNDGVSSSNPAGSFEFRVLEEPTIVVQGGSDLSPLVVGTGGGLVGGNRSLIISAVEGNPLDNAVANPVGNITLTLASGATLTVDTSGAYTYIDNGLVTTPTDTFTYTVKDLTTGQTFSRTATIQFGQLSAGNFSLTTDENTAAAVAVVDSTLSQLANLDANASIIQLERYGWSVAMDGDAANGEYAVLGSETTGDTNFVLVYKRVGNEWQFLDAIEDNGLNDNDEFGYDVAVDAQSQTIVIGAYGDDAGPSNDGGAIYIYKPNNGDDTDWVLSETFDGSAGGALDGIDGSDGLGISVAIDNDGAGNIRIVAGAYLEDSWNDASGVTNGANSGAVYVFKDQSAGADGSDFEFEQRIKAETVEDRASGDFFGRGVDIEGNYIVVAAERDHPAGVSSGDAGSAYIFELQDLASVNIESDNGVDAVTANSGLTFTAKSVANNDVTISFVAGAATQVQSVTGHDIVIELAAGASANDVITAVTNSAGQTHDADALVTVTTFNGNGGGEVGATAGPVSLGQWTQTGKLANTVATAANDRPFDVSVTTSSTDGNTRVIMGVRTNDNNGSNAGAALIYVEDGGSWGFEDVIQPESIASDDQFGWNVSILGDTALVGSRADDAGGEVNRGSAYIFQIDDTRASALLHFGGNNTGVRIYADNNEAIGVVSVEFVNNVASSAQAPSVTLVGTTIQVELGDDGAGTITTLASDVASAINAAGITIPSSADPGLTSDVSITAEIPSNGNGLSLGNGSGNQGNNPPTIIPVAVTGPVLMTAHWEQKAVLAGSDIEANDRGLFGHAVAMSEDPNSPGSYRFLVSDPYRDAFLPGASITVNGTSATVKIGEFGGAYVFEGSGDFTNVVENHSPELLGPETITGATDHILRRLTSVNEYGLSVDIAGDIAVVGSPGGGGQSQDDSNSVLGDNIGVAYVFQRDTRGTADTSDDTWTLLQTLRAINEPEASDDFGRDVAISEDGSTIAIGAPLLDHNGTYTDVGGLYIYSRGDDGSYFQDGFSHFTGGHDTNSQDEFNRLGFNLDINEDGSRIVVGAYLEEIDVNLDGSKQNSVGAVYIYDRPGGVGTWTNQGLQQGDAEGTAAPPAQPAGVTRLVATDPETGAQFGRDVTISDDGNRIVVGAFGNDTGGSNRGRLYTFDLSDADPANWQATGTAFQPGDVLTSVPGGGDLIGDNDQLGLRIEFGGDGGEWLVASAHLDDDNGTDAGAVYIFKLNGAGTGYDLHQKLTAAGSGSTGATAEFGRAVSINEEGNLIAVGARTDNTFGGDVGAIYLFEFDGTQAIGSQWSLKDGPVIDQNRDSRGVVDGADQFGRGIAISGNTVIAGGYNADFIFQNGTQVRNYGTVAAFDVTPITAENATVQVKADGFGTIVNMTNSGRASNGSLSVVNGEVQFDPGSDFDDLKAGESELVTFTYTLEDTANGQEAVGTITVTVKGKLTTVGHDKTIEIPESGTGAAPGIFGVLPAAGISTDGLLLNYEPGRNGADEQGAILLSAQNPAETDQDFQLGSYATYTDINGGLDNTNAEGLDAAIVFDGTGAATNGGLDEAAGNLNNAPVTFEFWIKPTNDTDDDLVFETGGAVTGMAIWIDGGTKEARFTIDATVNETLGDNGNVNNVLSTTEFNHIVATYERDVSGTDDRMRLWVNGNLIEERTANFGGWTGGDNAALGGVNSAVAEDPQGTTLTNSGSISDGVTNFEGELAAYRLYTRTFEQADVDANRNAILNPVDSNYDGDPIQIVSIKDNNGVHQVFGTDVNFGDAVQINGDGDTVALNADGSFVFTPGDTRFDVLDPGDTDSTVSFAYQLIDSPEATVTLRITGENDAPTINNAGAPTLTTISEDDDPNNGNTVAEILNGVADDPDGDQDSTNLGLALTGTTESAGSGKWQYSIDGGTNWLDVGSISDTTAILLESDDRLRFLPDTIVGGTATITYRAWDGSDGSAGGDVLNLSGEAGGGTSAFSVDSETSVLTINDVNDGIDAIDDGSAISRLVASTNVAFTGNVFDDNGNGADNDADGDTFTVTGTSLTGENIVGTTLTGTTSRGAAVTIDTVTGALTYDATSLAGGNSFDDSFTYTITDSLSGSDTATVFFSVLDLAPPGVTGETYTVDMDAGSDNGVLTVADGAGDLLDNDNPGADGSSIFIVIDLSDQISTLGATVSYDGAANNGNGGFTYDATNSAVFAALAEGETINDTFDYVVENNVGVRSTGTATVTVTGDGDIVIDLTKNLPAGFTATGVGSDDTVVLSDNGGELQISVNGEVLRDPSAISSLATAPNVTLVGTAGDTETLTVQDISAKALGDLTIGSDVDVFDVNGSLLANSLTVSSTTETLLGDDAGAITITTNGGNQLYQNSITLNGDVVLTTTAGGNVFFNQAVDSDPGERALTVNADGKLAINADIGGASPLGSFDTSGSNLVEVGQGDENGAFDVLQGDLVWNFDFSAAGTGASQVDDLEQSVDVDRNNTFNLFPVTGGVTTATIAAATGTNTPVNITVSGQIPGGDITAGANGGFSVREGTSDSAPQNVLGNPDFGNVSFEFWINPDQVGTSASPLANHQSIWETGGGTGTGFAIMNDGILRMRQTTGGREVDYDLNADNQNVLNNTVPGTYSTGQWIHVVGTLDLESDTTDELRLYVNGTLVGTNGGEQVADWDGGDPSALGAIGGANMGGWGGGTAPAGQFQSFDGQIAIFRMYDNVLSGGATIGQTGGQVSNNFSFQDSANLGPASISVTTTGNQNLGTTTIGSDLTINSSGAVTLSGNLDDDGLDSTNSNVTISSSANTTFNGLVGNGQAIDSLTVTAGGTIHVHGDASGGNKSVVTTRDQTYNGAVHTIANTETVYEAGLAGNRGEFGNINFNGNLTTLANSPTTINSAGNVTVTGTADFGGTLNATVNTLTFDGAVTLAADATITADDDLIFNGTLTGTTANLVTNVDDLSRYGGDTSLASITENRKENLTGRTELAGDLTLNGSGSGNFNKPLAITADSVVDLTNTTGSVDFLTIDATGAFDLTINSGTGGNASSVNIHGDIGGDALGGVSRDLGLDSFTITGEGVVTIDNTANLQGILNSTG